jgi:hypothetical protein
VEVAFLEMGLGVMAGANRAVPGDRGRQIICLRHAAVIEGGWAAIKAILFRHRMNLSARIKSWLGQVEKPLHLRHGELGECAARKHLKRQGLKFLTANFRTPRGEIDLVCRDQDCLQNVSFDRNISIPDIACKYAMTGDQLRKIQHNGAVRRRFNTSSNGSNRSLLQKAWPDP